LDKKLDKN